MKSIEKLVKDSQIITFKPIINYNSNKMIIRKRSNSLNNFSCLSNKGNRTENDNGYLDYSKTERNNAFLKNLEKVKFKKYINKY